MLRRKAKRDDSAASALEINTSLAKSSPPTNKGAITPGFNSMFSDENRDQDRKTPSSDVEFITPNSSYHQYPFSYSPTISSSGVGGISKGNLSEKFGLDSVNREGQIGGLGSSGNGHWATHDAVFANSSLANPRRPLVPPRQNSASASIDMGKRAATSPSSSSSIQAGGQYFYQQDISPMLSPNEIIQQQQQYSSNGSSPALPPMGRSQSTFNFFLSKAKASFTSTGNQHQQSSQDANMNSSGSLASLNSGGHAPYGDHSAPSSPTAIRRVTPDSATPRQGGIPRPSFGDETAATSSPTKRSFFGGSRERKVSTHSNSSKGTIGMLGASSASDKGSWGPSSSSNYNKQVPPPHSPLTREHRMNGSGLQYSQYSKSQTDLHSRGGNKEFPSPVKGSAALPPLPPSSSKFPYKSKPVDSHLLQSPTSTLGFSRSVDDLSRSSSPDQRSAPAHSPGQERDARWAEQASLEPLQRGRNGNSSSNGSHIEQHLHQNLFASTPAYQANATLRNTAWPQDTSMPPPPAPNYKRPATSPRDGIFDRAAQPQTERQANATRQLVPGVTFEAFLNRNTNISLPLNQLSDSRGKEKDLTKGWKPYKVILKEGRLHFYKPNGAYTDQVKALFPLNIVSGNQTGSSQYVKDMGINIDDLKKSKLGTQDLLAATSRGSLDQAPMMRPIGKRQPVLSAIIDTDQDEIKTRSWERRGTHRDLILVESQAEPARWVDRIEAGSAEALAHEYIYATQSDGTPNQEESERFIYSIIIAVSRSEQALQQVMKEIARWTEMAMSLTKEDTFFDGKTENQQSFQGGVQKRVSLLLECDVLNITSNPTQVLADIEKMVSGTWSSDAKQKEAVLAKVNSARRVAAATDWLSKEEDEEECVRLSSSLRPSALLNLDPAEVARQIHIFTSNRFNSLHVRDNSLLSLLQPTSSDSLHHFSFDWSRPHFLTKLVLEQILYSNSSLEGGSLHGAKLRASLLRHWIAVASYLIKLDNVGAWLSICVALCSRSVSRLATSWKFVASNDRALVGTVWAPVLVKLGWSEMNGMTLSPIEPYLATASSIKSSMNPRHHSRNDSASKMNSICPYLGNAFIHVDKLAINSAQSTTKISDGRAIAECILKTTKDWQSKQIQTTSKSSTEENVDLQRALQSLCVLNNRSANATFDPIPLLAQSIQIEPVTLGKLDHSRKAQLDKAMSACAQSPLLFPESLPTLSIVDRDEQESVIVAASVAADSSGEFRRSPVRITPNPFNQLNQETITNGATRWTSRNHAAKLSKDAPYSQIIEWNPHWQKEDVELIKIGTDLILIDMGEQTNTSMPSTPLLAKRFSQEMGTKSRPVSQISKRSSLPASNRSSLIDMPVISLQVLVKNGSIDRLVDVLVMGLQHVSLEASEDNIERKRSRLVLDLVAYRKTFLSTYRNFCSPVALFDLLRKRYSAAISASRELSLPLQHRSAFPSWSQIESASTQATAVDWDVVSRIRLGVMTLMTAWIEGAPQDFAENDQLYKGVLLWIEDMSTSSAIEGDVDWQKSIDSLKELQKQVQLAVMTCCIRQGERRTVRRSSKRTSSSQDIKSKKDQAHDQIKSEASLKFDEASPVELVDYLESVAKVFFEKIDEKDFLMACELFQSRNNDPMAWFIAKNSTSVLASQHRDEIPQVNNMYKLLELIRWPRDGPTLSLRLATSIRDACAAQNLLRGWIAIQIIESNIGLAKREARIEKLLDAVWICRARMLNSRLEEATSKLQPASIFREPTIASFVECLIVGSLNSSESRLFTRAWLGVALKRKGNCDNLYSLVPSASVVEEYREATSQKSTPDIGWILKTLAEVSTRYSSEGNGESGMIDYDKYRTMWAIIESSIAFSTKDGKTNAIDPDLVELAGARLSAMQNALRNVTWERRAFQENARMEASNAPLLNGNNTMQLMRSGKPLTDMLSLQQDKHRRDKGALKMLEYYQQQRRSQEALAAAEAARNASNNSTSMVFSHPRPSQGNQSAAMSTFVPVNPSQGVTSSSSEKRTKRMTALFRGAVRPMGGLMGSSSSSTEKVSSNLAEAKMPSHSAADLLAMTSSQKPSLVVNCGSSRVSIWNNNQRSFVFNLSLLEGGHHLLQATNYKEMMECFAALETASKDYAMPGLMAAAGDAFKAKGSKKPALPSVPFYGTDVKTLVELEKRPIPLGLLRMLEEVEARGLREQGIYRISGAKNAIEGLKQAWSKLPAEAVDLAHGEFSDIHTIAGAIKQWFRDLPEPVVPYAFYHRLIEAEQVEKEEDRLYAIRDLVWEFPKVHFDLLRRTSQHLALVCDEGKYNLMAPHNIGLVFGTSLLNPPPGPSSVAESFGNIGKAAHIVKIIITMHEWLFEPEPEAEQEGEGEGAAGEIESEVEEVEKLGGASTADVSNMAVEGGNASIDARNVDTRDVTETSKTNTDRQGEEDYASNMPASSSSQATLMPLPSRENLVNRVEGIPTITIEEDDAVEEKRKREIQIDDTKGRMDTISTKGEKRDRAVVESIYLDATDAIAVLQDPFLGVDIEEEEENTH